jgi:threonylcarbamoyladenosine tRNA methylthiotransferase MtaB
VRTALDGRDAFCPRLEGVDTSFHIENFGCRAARADGEAIATQLQMLGATCSDGVSAADVIVVNTCSVTAEADRAARAFIRRTHRLNPEARIVATGCYAQRAPEELAGLDGVAAVIGNSHKALASEIVLGLGGRPQALGAETGMVSVATLLAGQNQTLVPGGTLVLADDRFAHSFLEEAQVVPGVQTRPNLKIQEGCGNRCSFCVIPQTRGSSRSLPAAEVMRQVEGFITAGGVELVFSGINLGRFSSGSGDGPPLSLAGLVRRIFEQTRLPRLRLSSIEPMDWDIELIELMARFGGSRLARHAHLPLQSGSDAVLRRMHRRYRPWHYAEKVEALLRAAGPELTLGADVMVGFPGETDAEFEETLAFVRSLPFGYLHLFPFSPRPATRAWAMHQANPVPGAVVDERMTELRALATAKTEAHRESLVRRELDALTLHTPEGVRQTGRTAALTENFVPVELEGVFEANRPVRVHALGLNAEGALRAMVGSEKAPGSGQDSWASTGDAATLLRPVLAE